MSAQTILKKSKFNSKIVTLREKQTFDIKTKKQLEKYERLDKNEMKSYINSLKTIVYDYENDELPDKSKILKDIKIASKNMIEKIKRFDSKITNQCLYRNK